MPLTVPLQFPSKPPRAAIFRAFDIPDDGSDAFEIGLPATGSTCLLQCHASSNWTLSLALLRAEFFAKDLFPAIESAAQSLGASFFSGPSSEGQAPPSLLAQWTAARDEEIVAAQARSDADGLSPLPRMPAEELAAAHAWLVAADSLAALYPNFAPDIIAVVSDETGAAMCATVVGRDSPTVLVSPVHGAAVVDDSGVAFLDLHSFARTPDRLVEVRPEHWEDAATLGPDMRTTAVVEVLEQQTLARLGLPT